MTVVIIAGGSIDKEFAGGFIKGLDESSLFIIACDKGYESCLNLGVRPSLIIGDFDSAAEESYDKAKASGIELIKLNPIKDDTDAEAALDIAISKTESEDTIYLLGATGTRLDHVMGNIGLVGKGLKQNRKVIMVDKHNRIRMITNQQSYSLSKEDAFGKYVSVFAYLGPVKGLTMTGFKYPVEGAEVTGFNTLTVSNELVEDTGVITIESGYLVIMETAD